jgi:hypothetical protein
MSLYYKFILFVFLNVFVFVFVIVFLPLVFGSSPLEEGWGTISHAAGTMIFPAQFMLVVAAAPVAICPLIVAFALLAVKSQNCARFQVVSGV